MSHLATIHSIIRDPAALRAACARLGWELEEQAKPRLWRARGPECTFVVSQPGQQRNLGLQAQEDGTYTLVYDSMDARYVGQLHQAYNYAVIESEAALAGLLLTSQVLEDGTISLTLEGY